MKNLKRLTVLVLLTMFVSRLLAQQQSCIKVSGEVTIPLQLCAADISKMSHSIINANDRGGKVHKYEGVLLSDILIKAGVPMGKELRGEHLAKYLLVTSADNYQVVFSLAELDSVFTDKKVILADKMDDKPLSQDTGPFRVVVEDAKRPARNSFQVVALTVLFAKEKD